MSGARRQALREKFRTVGQTLHPGGWRAEAVGAGVTATEDDDVLVFRVIWFSTVSPSATRLP